MQLRATRWPPSWRSSRRVPWALGWVLLPLVALFGYVAALAASGWGWLAPFAGESLWHRATAGPILLLGVLVGAGWALWECRRRLGLEYTLYALAALIVCTASTFRGQPLLSLDRFVLTIFPLWMAAGAWVARRKLTAYVVPVGAVALVVYAFWFARWSFIA
jgi:hypothetical protein